MPAVRGTNGRLIALKKGTLENNMMQITLARIDNRLLHGIVMTQYLPQSHSDRVMVIDDAVANDPTAKSMMMLAKPNGIAASIITLEKALTNMKAGKYDGQKVFLLSKTPHNILEVVKAGEKISELCIGCTDLLDQGIKLSSRAFVTEEQFRELQEIKSYGVHIYIQHNPQITPVEFSKIEKERR